MKPNSTLLQTWILQCSFYLAMRHNGVFFHSGLVKFTSGNHFYHRSSDQIRKGCLRHSSSCIFYRKQVVSMTLSLSGVVQLLRLLLLSGGAFGHGRERLQFHAAQRVVTRHILTECGCSASACLILFLSILCNGLSHSSCAFLL